MVTGVPPKWSPSKIAASDRFWLKPGYWKNCSVWTTKSRRLPPPPPPPPNDAPLPRVVIRPRGSNNLFLLVIGTIADPRKPWRREWIRRDGAVARATMQHVFVIGDQRVATPSSGWVHTKTGWTSIPAVPPARLRAQHQAMEAALAHEQATHGDIFTVRARDYAPYAVAEKTLGWYRAALTLFPNARYVAKTDDDSILNLRTLLADLRALNSADLYYGVLRWRMWQPSNACACGPRSNEGPPSIARRRSWRLSESSFK